MRTIKHALRAVIFSAQQARGTFWCRIQPLGAAAILRSADGYCWRTPSSQSSGQVAYDSPPCSDSQIPFPHSCSHSPPPPPPPPVHHGVQVMTPVYEALLKKVTEISSAT
jgi:hypothetical protein